MTIQEAEWLKQQLRNELDESGNIIELLNARPPVLRLEDGIDTALAKKWHEGHRSALRIAIDLVDTLLIEGVPSGESAG